MLKTEKGINVFGKELTILRKTKKAGEKILLKEGFINKYHSGSLVKNGIVSTYNKLCGYWILE